MKKCYNCGQITMFAIIDGNSARWKCSNVKCPVNLHFFKIKDEEHRKFLQTHTLKEKE